MEHLIKLHSQLLFGGGVPKSNESPPDSQDNWAYNKLAQRYAIADGAGSTFLSATWSKLLVDHFCDQNNNLNNPLFKSKDWQSWLDPIQKEWQAQTEQIVNKNTGLNTASLRYRHGKKEPAGSTFVGLQIDTNDKLEWQAMIVGDSCLFHLRDNTLESKLLKQPTEFDNHPEVFSSYAKTNMYPPKFIEGTCRNSDIFILATDALAKWILTKYIMGGENWQSAKSKIVAIKKWNELYNFIQEARVDIRCPLEDDDVALMIITIIDRKTEYFPDFIDPVVDPVKPPVVPLIPQPEQNKKLPEQVDNHKIEITDHENLHLKRLNNLKKIAWTAVVISIISLLLGALNLFLYFHKDTNAAVPANHQPLSGISTTTTITTIPIVLTTNTPVASP